MAISTVALGPVARASERRVSVIAVRGTDFWDAVACIMSAQTSLNHKEAA
jgi:hypothetical protein